MSGVKMILVQRAGGTLCLERIKKKPPEELEPEVSFLTFGLKERF
jgi:hypothetical protein